MDTQTMSNKTESIFVGIGTAALTVAGVVSASALPVELKVPVATAATVIGSAILAFWSKKVNIPVQ